MTVLVAALFVLSVLCPWLAIEANLQRRRAEFWRKAFNDQHELHMQHLRERRELLLRPFVRYQPRSWS